MGGESTRQGRSRERKKVRLCEERDPGDARRGNKGAFYFNLETRQEDGDLYFIFKELEERGGEWFSALL